LVQSSDPNTTSSEEATRRGYKVQRMFAWRCGYCLLPKSRFLRRPSSSKRRCQNQSVGRCAHRTEADRLSGCISRFRPDKADRQGQSPERWRNLELCNNHRIWKWIPDVLFATRAHPPDDCSVETWLHIPLAQSKGRSVEQE